MKSSKKTSVAGKIVTGAMLLVLVAAITTAYMAVTQQTAAMEGAQKSAANLLASSVAISSATQIVQGDIASLEQTVRRLRQANPEVLWILITDPAGKVLAVDPEQVPIGEPQSGPIQIGTQKFGEIKLIFDRTPIDRARSEIIGTTFGVTAALLLVVLCAALVWAQIFARPIVALAEAAERVSQGDLNTRVDVTRTDEIGRLSERFNEMVENLKRSRVELERTLNELSTLYGVSKIINTTSDRNEILRLNIETLATGFRFSPVVILLEVDHIWRVGASNAGQAEGQSIDPAAIGLADAITSQTPVVIEPSRLPSAWGFGAGKAHAAGLRSGSNLVGILIAGGEGAQDPDAEKVLAVVASQIAPPILISIMIEREMNKVSNPFDYIRDRIAAILDKAQKFGLSVSILAFRLEEGAWKGGASVVEKRFRDLTNGIRTGISDSELIVRYGANCLIAVIPGWSKSEARSALMTLELPHQDELNIAITSSPEDGASADDLLAALERV